jgi:hypothetical protein
MTCPSLVHTVDVPTTGKEIAMPTASPASAERRTPEGAPVEAFERDLGGYIVNFVTFQPDMDQTPLLKGLPDDRCQCPHWGYVFEGSVTYRFADHEENVLAGEAFYLPPGHVPVGNAPNSVIVQFSPTDELRKTEKVLFENLQAMGSAT